MLYTRGMGALNRNYFNTYVWRPALVRAGVEPIRENGTHALRHFYASVALHEGESIKALSEHLVHADPGFTLRTYTHLDESSAERTEGAIDSLFGIEHEPELDPDADAEDLDPGDEGSKVDDDDEQ